MTMIPIREQPPRLIGPTRRAAGPGPLTGRAGIGPRELMRVVRRRKWVILLTLVICSGAMFTATLLWWQYAPLYRVLAFLEVSPPPATILQGQNPMYGKEIVERYKGSLAALVKHQSVWDEALKDPEITRTDWYKNHRDKAYEALDEAITVADRPGTQLLVLSMTGMNKEELAPIVNGVSYAFIKVASTPTVSERESAIKRLQREQTTLQNRQRSVWAEIARVRGGPQVLAMPERQTLLTQRLQMFQKQVTEAEGLQAQAAAALKSYQDAADSGALASDPMILQAVDYDMPLRNLSYRRIELETSLDNLSRKLGDDNRTLKMIKGMLEAVDTQVEARRQEVTKTAIEQLAGQRKVANAVLTQQVADLKDRLNQAKSEAQDLEEALALIGNYEQEAREIQDSLRQITLAIRDRQIMASELRPGEAMGPVRMAGQATRPREVYAPRWELMMPVGVVAGLLLGFALAFLLEFLDTTVKTPSDIARRVDLPLLGMIPHGDDLEEDIPDFRRASLVAPLSPAAEAFRQLRTNLLYTGPAEQRRSLLVTSPSPEDGRTAVVMNLAISMAQAGRRVLVVDANFRQPALAEMFPGAPKAGLSSALVGQAAWRDVVAASDVPNLSVMTSGPLPPNPAELLGSQTMRQLVSELAAEYDTVLFDGPPAMLVVDASVLATQVDGVILIVRAGANNAGIVQKTAEQLSRVGAHVIGVVLEGVRTTAGGYLRRNYETFYEYHQKALP